MTGEQREHARWHCVTELRKFDEDGNLIEEPTVIEENLVMFGGVSNIWQCLMGNGSSGVLAYFNNTNSAIGVGDSTTAGDATLNDLVASTNKLRKAMDSTYPQHTAGTAAANSQITFRSTFGSSEANYAWNEWGVFNSATAGAGRMLNRKQESLGTKVTNSTWQLTVTLSIA